MARRWSKRRRGAMASACIRKRHHSAGYRKVARKFGKRKAHKQAIAIGLSKAGLSRGKKKRRRRGRKR